MRYCKLLVLIMIIGLLAGCDLLMIFVFPDVKVIIINSSESQISAVYARTEGADTWGQNRLAETLDDSHTAELTIPRDRYEFYAEFVDGSVTAVLFKDLFDVEVLEIEIRSLESYVMED